MRQSTTSIVARHGPDRTWAKCKSVFSCIVANFAVFYVNVLWPVGDFSEIASRSQERRIGRQTGFNLAVRR